MGKEKSPRRVADNEALAVGTTIRGSAQKLNLVAGLIRGKKAEVGAKLGGAPGGAGAGAPGAAPPPAPAKGASA